MAMVLLAPLAARADLPRLVSLFDLPAEGGDRFPFVWPEGLSDFLEGWEDGGAPPSRSNELVEPVVFWSADGLLCAEAEGAVGMVDCHDPVRGGDYGVPPVRRKRPPVMKRATTKLALGTAALERDGLITSAAVKTVAKLRCRRSPLLDRKEYRYLAGPGGQLAVLVLEEDDRQVACANLDAQCGPPSGPRYWRVLLSVPACPAP